MLRKYLRGTQGRLDLCFGGFRADQEPNCPLPLIQPSGAIEETGPIFVMFVCTPVTLGHRKEHGNTYLHICCETGTLSSVHGVYSRYPRQEIMLPSSFLRPSFSMDLNIGDRVFYTRCNGMRVPTTVVGTTEDGLLHLEYYQDAVKVALLPGFDGWKGHPTVSLFYHTECG